MERRRNSQLPTLERGARQAETPVYSVPHLEVRQRAVAIYPLALMVVRLHLQALRIPVTFTTTPTHRVRSRSDACCENTKSDVPVEAVYSESSPLRYATSGVGCWGCVVSLQTVDAQARHSGTHLVYATRRLPALSA